MTENSARDAQTHTSGPFEGLKFEAVDEKTGRTVLAGGETGDGKSELIDVTPEPESKMTCHLTVGGGETKAYIVIRDVPGTGRTELSLTDTGGNTIVAEMSDSENDRVRLALLNAQD